MSAALSERLDPACVEVQAGLGRRMTSSASPDAVFIDVPSGKPGAVEDAAALVGRLRDGTAVVVAIGDNLSPADRLALYQAGVLACVATDDDPEELVARLTTLVSAKRSAGVAIRRLREHTRNLDEQLRLAQRLQMDFLPRRMPEVGAARFAARIEPAAWVAGDFYDIFRLDERHVGFYIADAVGHGIPAALLTVFVKKSLQTKRIEGKHYELIPPQESLALLNADLLSAQLQDTPFITMIYGIYDEETRDCTYARAGHPRPVLLGPTGSLELLDGDGPLLGIFPDATFDAYERRLVKGERLLLYTDGAERIEAGRRADPAQLLELIRASALLPIEALLDAIFDSVRAATGGDHLADDVTVVALDMEP
ncbi:MAG: PP2C family protein-serine/threonine phosphatase [Planctomycetota bacterium]|nr:PP2C family protein-serine/threonine phosphatase [Planctomycetota bacterium]